jgi:hypothetical protein
MLPLQGLLHDGQEGGSAYYSGSGEWAPIMGVAYWRPLSQFAKEYASSNNHQDDIAIISQTLPLLQAAGGAAPQSATPLSPEAPTATGTVTARATGVVVLPETPAYFSFDAPVQGTAMVRVAVAAAWPIVRSNLDARISVFDSADTLLASADPTGVSTDNGLGIEGLPVPLPSPGRYYIAIMGAGAGSSTSSNYTSYGSRGQFTLSVTYPLMDGSLQPPTESPSPSPPPPESPSPSPPLPESPSPSPPPPESPSPSPPLPPSPSPSPSPTPVQQLLFVQQITITHTCSSSSCMCVADVRVLDKVSQGPIRAARVFGVWTAQPSNAATWTPLRRNGVTAANGIAKLRAAGQTSNGASPGRCTFKVTAVTAAGYRLDTSSSQLMVTHTVSVPRAARIP